MSIQIGGPAIPPDGSVTTAKIASGNAGDGQVLTADGAGGAAWEAASGGGPGHLEYVALLTQSGTAAPVATVLVNTLGVVPVWERVGVGHYRLYYNPGDGIGPFTVGKTVVCMNEDNNGFQFEFSPGSYSTEINLNSYRIIIDTGEIFGDAADGAILNRSVFVRVYP